MISLSSLFSAFWIALGLFVIAKYFNMCRYQVKYGGNAGKAYLRGKLKEYIKTGVFKE